MQPSRSLPCLLLALFCVPPVPAAAPPVGAAPSPAVLDRLLLDRARRGSEAMANLTHLSDVIGPRLTGSANLKRANEWAARKMTEYGLVNVHQEAWSFPEGWERGSATARVVEPDTGRTLSLASLGWTPGTPGKVTGDVVALTAQTAKEFEPFKGKLKGAIVLAGGPVRLHPLSEIEKPGGSLVSAYDPPLGTPAGTLFERLLFQSGRDARLREEGVAAVLMDSGKHLGQLNAGALMGGGDRPSATNRMPTLFVAHSHYAMLYRLATRPGASGRTRLELEVSNRFVPGPLAVYNTVGEIRGREKPDEIVVVGAHLDSWDLGQGTTDNGTGTAVVLEAARVLAGCGVKPRRTIRFVLFTGEEQGLLGSFAYAKRHKDEMPRISACLIHDTGTGKVLGIGARHRPVLQPLLRRELAGLKDSGVDDFNAIFIPGSDHVPFEINGVPGLMFHQEVAGYRVTHHSQADTLDQARPDDLVQGAQVMAVAAARVANLDGLLPRERVPGKKEKPAAPGKK